MRATRMSSSGNGRSGAAANATAKAARPNGKAGKGTERPSEGSASTDAGAPGALPLASFLPMEAAVEDVPMWPQHPVAWLEPQLDPVVSVTSGLGVERRNKIPSPGFLAFAITLVSEAGCLQEMHGLMTPQVHLELPKNDSVPLGWDPRSAIPGAPREGRKISE